MKKLLYIVVLTVFTIFNFNNVLAQGDGNKYYYNGKITYSSKEGKDLPLGIKVTVIYNDFFKNYKIQYTDSRDLPQEIIFENKTRLGYTNSLTNDGCEYSVNDVLSSRGALLLLNWDGNCKVSSYTIQGCVKSKR